MEESIPAYGSSASALYHVPSPVYEPPISSPPGSARYDSASEPLEMPPSYTPIDPRETTFTILGTFIHTNSGPAYQLSRALNQRHYNLFIRRLRPKEQQKALHTPLPFDYDAVLYEVIAGSSIISEESVIKGHRKSCLPGTLTLKGTERKTWFELSSAPNTPSRSVLRAGAVGLGARKVLKKRGGGETSEWKDAQGKVVAKEILRDAKDGGIVPVLEVEGGVDSMWREAIVACWVARLWNAYAAEKNKGQERTRNKIFGAGGPVGWRLFGKEGY
ncbi:hypothetical protein GQ43DRAFT_440855 [Delitschia confertaspora ATCC 74209]|uniref:Uncharacterized protein n=1 Tax=Delitschia confertaspora ATCC 74209 TaxID=1513339 RepID=A0A9P4JKS3_9PLEO|nr:hypothetical protein GQ43DRAFT_440855 [Delitschia confertaspora ATCC 74209]